MTRSILVGSIFILFLLSFSQRQRPKGVMCRDAASVVNISRQT